MGEQGLGSTSALTILHWHKKFALHSAPWWESQWLVGVGGTTEPQLREKNVLPALESWAVGAPADRNTVAAAAVSLWS